MGQYSILGKINFKKGILIKTMEILLEEKETPIVYYYCIATNDCRYDFSIIYSNMFCGKAMVISIQTGNMVLLCSDDMEDDELWIEKLGIKMLDIVNCKAFLQLVLQQI
ncbi:SAV0927 family protein [Priestia megaterium]|uniref:SAV0927 family protein n=1 Tax=Priestia megaterium TaxID=1404 RepID=UPI001951810D|nr:SAV0927 family protein [Priestia megaterium]MBM6602336.1 DUF3055 family protein [Priestia megaterium]MBV6737720.1 DUF3055 domain-containing protein [Priestia megaterium]